MRPPVPRLHAAVLSVTGLLVSVVMCALASRGLEPVATWLYPFAWYPLLLALEGGIALRHGRFFLLRDPTLLLSVVAWSVPLWMLWELINFRIENWYYVFVPDRRVALWTGVVLSFGTVLPACFLPAVLLWPRSPAAPGHPNRSSPSRESRSADPDGPSPTASRALSPRALRGIRLAGVAMLAVPLLWPRIFFPLVWGGFVLLVEPDLYRRTPARSLLADVVAGRAGRIVSLLAGGALAGLTWEALNDVARGKWIYTVPYLEELKLFEMPLLGFLGFPPLALSCFSLYQWLGQRGWAVPLRLDPTLPGEEPGAAGKDRRPVHRTNPRAARVRAGAGRRLPILPRLAAGILVVLTLLGMEAWTVSSRTPRLRDLPVMLPSDVETLGVWGVDSPFELAETRPGELVERVPGVSEEEARAWIDAARLATTRGIGTRNARILHRWGITSLEDLAGADPESLVACFRSDPAGGGIRPAVIRVWSRAAREATGESDDGPGVTPSCPAGAYRGALRGRWNEPGGIPRLRGSVGFPSAQSARGIPSAT